MASYAEVSESLLSNLCRDFGLSSHVAAYSDIQRFLFDGWGEIEVPPDPVYPSMVGDDHSPFEYSMAFGATGLELRLLFEVQASEPSASANQAAALKFNERLATRFGGSLARFSAVRDLFLPTSAPNSAFLWHGVCFSERAVNSKVYMNPQVFGPDGALPTVSEALIRLGLAAAVPTIEQIVRARDGRDVLNYFSLDLSDQSSARVKVYFRHEGATPQELEQLFAVAPTHRAGDVIEFTRAMLGGDHGLNSKPATSCFAFTTNQAAPSAVAYHLPIAHYVSDDSVAVARSVAYLKSQGQALAARQFEAAARAFSLRELSAGCGMQSYSSYRRDAGGVRFTAYLSPELFRDGAEYRSQSRLRSASSRELSSRTH